jgi:hypothetical protein
VALPVIGLTPSATLHKSFRWSSLQYTSVKSAPVMTAPLNEVFPVTSAPSRLALVRLACSCAWKAKLDHDN